MLLKSLTEMLSTHSLHNIGPQIQYYPIYVNSQMQYKKLCPIVCRPHEKIQEGAKFQNRAWLFVFMLRSQQSYRSTKIILLNIWTRTRWSLLALNYLICECSIVCLSVEKDFFLHISNSTERIHRVMKLPCQHQRDLNAVSGRSQAY